MSSIAAAQHYRRREAQERATAVAAASPRLAERHLELADGYRILAEQAEEATLPAMRRLQLRAHL